MLLVIDNYDSFTYNLVQELGELGADTTTVRNDATPHIEVNPETYEVRVDGQVATCEPAERLPLTQLHFLV